MPKPSAVARALSLLALALLAARPVPAATDATDPVRQELLRRVNAERKAHGAAPAALDPKLVRAAQEHADDLASHGSIRAIGAGADGQEMQRRLRKAGYSWSECTESVTATDGDLDAALASWREGNPASYGEALDPSFTDLGIGLARVDGTTVYDFLIAVPSGKDFGRERATIEDPARLRAQLLAEVNGLRRTEHAPPLTASPRLDRVAQAHAEEMLARSFFDHRDSEGRTVRERAAAEGYEWREIAENLAEGPTTADKAMDGWMASADRKNVLERAFTELGVGFASGKDGKTGKSRVLWVQVFGTPK